MNEGSTLAATLPMVEANTVGITLSDVGAEALLDTKAATL